MSGASIAQEVAAALREVAVDVGEGSYVIELQTKANEAVNPWDADASSISAHKIPALVSRYSKEVIDGKLIKETDKRVMLSADEGVVPNTTMTVAINGEAHTIVDVAEVSPSGTALFYYIQARV